MSDDILSQFRQAVANLSYYNAAEGDSYFQEREARSKAYQEYSRLRDLVLRQHGQEVCDSITSQGLV